MNVRPCCRSSNNLLAIGNIAAKSENQRRLAKRHTEMLTIAQHAEWCEDAVVIIGNEARLSADYF
jgi:hypothetical protein